MLLKIGKIFSGFFGFDLFFFPLEDSFVERQIYREADNVQITPTTLGSVLGWDQSAFYRLRTLYFPLRFDLFFN